MPVIGGKLVRDQPEQIRVDCAYRSSVTRQGHEVGKYSQMIPIRRVPTPPKSEAPLASLAMAG